MFSEDEVFHFVENVLKVPLPKTRVSADRRALVEDVVVGMQTQLTFNNLSLLSVDYADRHRPSLEEIKQDLIKGYGGLCYNLNLGAFCVLKAMGFKVTLAHATVTLGASFENDHVIVYVSDVEKLGDKFVLETGVGFPTFRIVSLDFETESPAYQDSFIEYKYMKHDGKLLRMHRKGDTSSCSPDDPCTFIVEGWRRCYYADLEGTTDISSFDAAFDQVFTNPNATPFHLSFRIAGFPSGRATIISNDKTLIENDEGDLVSTVIEGGDEGISQTIQKMFPVFPEQLVRQALTNWRKGVPSQT